MLFVVVPIRCARQTRNGWSLVYSDFAISPFRRTADEVKHGQFGYCASFIYSQQVVALPSSPYLQLHPSHTMIRPSLCRTLPFTLASQLHKQPPPLFPSLPPVCPRLFEGDRGGEPVTKLAQVSVENGQRLHAKGIHPGS